ncbi:mechanosensitive ion channel family protein [Brucellaceae bacterium C25G]
MTACFFIWLFAGFLTTVHAETIVEEKRPVLNELKETVAQLEARFEQNLTNDEELANIKLKFDDASRKLLDIGVSFRPRLTEINTRLEQLGSAPKEGDTAEAVEVTDERTRLANEKAQINVALGETEDVSINVHRLSNKVVTIRRDLFTDTLSQRVDIDYSLGADVVVAAGDQLNAVGKIVRSWWRFVVSFKLNSFLAAMFFAFMAAVLLEFGARYFLGSLYQRDPSVETPSYLSRLSVAFWSTLIPSVAVGVFLLTTYYFLDYFNVLRSDIAQILRSIFTSAGLVYFIYRMSKAVISPDMPAWRLIPVAPRPGRVMLVLALTAALVNGLDYVFSTINQVLSSPLLLTVAKSLLSSLAIGMLIIWIALLKPIQHEEDGTVRSWPKLAKIVLILIGLIPVLSALSGYIGFARFASQQIMVSGAFIIMMYLGFLTARAIIEEGAFKSTKIGNSLQNKLNLDDSSMDQAGLIVGILINLMVLLIGLPLILMQFGFQWSELKNTFFRLMTGFSIGDFSISFTGILTGIVLFLVVYFFSRWFQKWFDATVMVRGRVDVGVRNSIRTVIGYIGLCLAALVGISAAGFNLSNLALIAGGLSLGIGFGLQNIVQNFVSGLILLAERPFKVGDWVEAGTVSGIVKKISVRATEVETFQRQSIIVPNSTLINGNVGNWTHHNKLGRIEINFQVPMMQEPRRVHAALLEVVRSNSSVLKNPAPYVALNSTTATQLIFDMYAFLADITNSTDVKNELRFSAIERLHQLDLEIEQEKMIAAATLEAEADNVENEAEQS